MKLRHDRTLADFRSLPMEISPTSIGADDWIAMLRIAHVVIFADFGSHHCAESFIVLNVFHIMVTELPSSTREFERGAMMA
ncbi:hypothetical protein P5W99_00805 [Paraburkholderia sp. A3BS-1L]|uniref:hypothetical protein n=1 Tax=Paraburkholderia sp. A3BS-1L TaxID=3028375 RepID=UPI003DA9B04E